MGYYPRFIKIYVEAKFDTPVEKGTYRYLYHAVPEKHLPKVQKIGLIPRSLGKIAKHPDRIYFATSPFGAEGIIQQFKYKG